MTVTRTGHRNSDAESGTVLDVWFPRDNQQIERNCLALKASPQGALTTKTHFPLLWVRQRSWRGSGVLHIHFSKFKDGIV